MELKEIVKELDEYKKIIEEHRVELYERLKQKDWSEAWKHLVILLEMCGRGLKTCNRTLEDGVLPAFKKAFEKNGAELQKREEILKEIGEVFVNKESVKKMMVIPEKSRIH